MKPHDYNIDIIIMHRYVHVFKRLSIRSADFRQMYQRLLHFHHAQVDTNNLFILVIVLLHIIKTITLKILQQWLIY